MRKDTLKKASEKKGIIETERVIYSEDGSTKMGVVKEQFTKVTKTKSIDASNMEYLAIAQPGCYVS